MKLYPEDYQVEVQVGFTDLNGVAIVPSAVTATLWDGDDQVVHDFGAIVFNPLQPSVTVVIAAAFNQLGVGQLNSARVLRVELTTPAGIIRRSHAYLLEGTFRLELMTNSFLTYEGADLMAISQVAAAGWDLASEDKRFTALIEAFNRLTRIPMKYSFRDENGILLTADEKVIHRDQWAEITPQMFAEFPTHFRKALRLAQFTEANGLLQGDNTAAKHRAGIISETIGESSVTLRAGRVDYGVSSPTLSCLAGYVYFNFRIARA